MDIQVKNISKSYGRVQVFDSLSLTFPQGEVTWIMGPSGCGKTTLLHMLMELTKPDSGSIEGVPKLKSAVFQENRLCESFNPVSNIALVCDKTVSKNAIISHLEAVGLKDSCDKPVHQLSGGMKRRVAIVRSILAPSQVLFMDEPFKGLDEDTKKATMKYVKDNTKGSTLIMVTHNPEELDFFQGNLVKL